MKYSSELEEFQVGTITHRHIRSRKQRLLGTIVVYVNCYLIKNGNNIIIAVENTRRNKQKNVTVIFDSLRKDSNEGDITRN